MAIISRLNIPAKPMDAMIRRILAAVP